MIEKIRLVSPNSIYNTHHIMRIRMRFVPRTEAEAMAKAKGAEEAAWNS